VPEERPPPLPLWPAAGPTEVEVMDETVVLPSTVMVVRTMEVWVLCWVELELEELLVEEGMDDEELLEDDEDEEEIEELLEDLTEGSAGGCLT
jgi:hypothetical protein